MKKIFELMSLLLWNINSILRYNRNIIVNIHKGTIYGMDIVDRIDNKPLTKQMVYDNNIFAINVVRKDGKLDTIPLVEYDSSSTKDRVVVYDAELYKILNAKYNIKTGSIEVTISPCIDNSNNIRHVVDLDELEIPTSIISRFRMAYKILKQNRL